MPNLMHFGCMTGSISINLEAAAWLQRSRFMALQREAGLTRDLLHVISWGSRLKQYGDEHYRRTCFCNMLQ